MSDDEEAARLRRELADAKVEQLEARLAELTGRAGQVSPTPTAPLTGFPVPGATPGVGQAQTPGTPGAAPVFTTTTIGHTPIITTTSNSVASPEAQAALRKMLDQFGLGQYMPNADGTFGQPMPVPGQPVTPPYLPLTDPPRRVPFSYRLLILPWRWWTVFTLFMIGVSPIAVWIFVPLAGVIVAAVTFLLVMVVSLRRYLRVMALLKWGVPASSVQAMPTDVGTYYSGTTYQNVRLPVAHGWTVTRQFYSGPGTTTRLKYQLNGQENELTLRGRAYIDGVILVDSRKPSRAACVTAIPFDLSERTPSGDWTGQVRVGTIIGAIFMAIFVFGWTAAMIYLCGRAADVSYLSFLG